MIQRRKLRQLVWVAVLLVAAGGNHVPPSSPDVDALSTLPPGTAPWTATGKIALTTVDHAETASFAWDRRSASRESVRFYGPFGLGAIEIHREGDDVYWLDGEARRPLADLGLSPGAVAILAHLPMTHLGDWLVGATPADATLWQQDIRRWQSFPPWRVPRLMTLHNEQLQLRIAVNDWVPE